MARPASNDYAAYYTPYVNQVQGDHITEVIDRYAAPIMEFVRNIPDAKADYRYADGKWTVKELLLHMIDAERIFAYRALRIARKDQTPLPGFEENAYAMASGADKRTLQSLKDEFTAVRASTDLLLRSFDEGQLAATGTASNNPVSVNAIAFIIFGHILHHQQVMQERYL